MRFDIITIFPDIFESYFSESILGRAQKNGLVEIKTSDLRQWTTDNHKTVDDRPYSGGAGMVMMVEPIFKAVESLKNFQFSKKKTRTILFSAKGKRMTQKDVRRWAKDYDQLILICGRYEGVDERVAEYVADEEISVGDYVLTGGEIPAMIAVDAVSRLVPGVIKEESLAEESFNEESSFAEATEDALFPDSAFSGERMGEYPQYTRPEIFNDWKVPEVLLSGNHEEIKKWRMGQQKSIVREKKEEGKGL